MASPQRAKPSLLLHKPPSASTRPSQGGKFVKASKGGGPTPSTTTTGPSLSTAATSPKTETKKKKKRKITKCTVTSETVSLPEKKRKLISESPDPEAEGPFRDLDHTECIRGLSSPPLVAYCSSTFQLFSGRLPLTPSYVSTNQLAFLL